MRRPERSGEREFVVRKVDGDDLARACDLGAQHRGETDAAKADHGDRGAWRDLCRIDHRADAGQHRAAEQRRELEGQIGVDPDTGFARHGRVGCEGRNAQMMIDRLAC